ncbi:hypothetical protein BCR42DRAFT_449689 [Absidia repens]|uniref:Cas12f1-like TNB domain-containing protein n=1 Tax=Absidia repens TaxID=90262 RepID=A0A1X2IL59_9FUNG|nr:hypothetical protein BCR42DRAFT_449689 [Absidia repens]
MTMRGTVPGMVARLRRTLKKAEQKHLLVMVQVNEAYTSKVCSKCYTKNMVNKKIDDGDYRLHSVLVCSDCNTTWNRDVNACNNIHHLAICLSQGADRPSIFCRPTTSNPTTSQQQLQRLDKTIQ